MRIEAPLVGDIGSCVSALLAAIGSNFVKPPAEWTSAVTERKNKNVAKMAETLAKNPSPMNFHSALAVVRDIVAANPDAILVNEGANALDFTRSIVDMRSSSATGTRSSRRRWCSRTSSWKSSTR